MTRRKLPRRASLGKLFIWQWMQFNSPVKQYFNRN